MSGMSFLGSAARLGVANKVTSVPKGRSSPYPDPLWLSAAVPHVPQAQRCLSRVTDSVMWVTTGSPPALAGTLRSSRAAPRFLAPWETPKSCWEGLSTAAWHWEQAGGGKTLSMLLRSASVGASGGLIVSLNCVAYRSGLGWGGGSAAPWGRGASVGPAVCWVWR